MNESLVYFAATYDHVLDAKNRMAIPAEIRSDIQAAYGLGSEGTVSFYATIAKDSRALSLYTKQDFQKVLRQGRTPGQNDPKMVQELNRLARNSKTCDVDRQGRLLLPEVVLARLANPLKDRVKLVGMNDHMEVWDPEAYERFEAEEAGGYVDPMELLAAYAPLPNDSGG